MMRYLAALLLIGFLASPIHAATLTWTVEQSGAGPLTIERGDASTGPFVTVATLPEGVIRFELTPGAWGHYRVTNSAGSSNTAQYSADLYSGFLADRVDALEVEVGQLKIRVSSLEQAPQPDAPAPASNFTVRDIDIDHVEILGTNCASLATTGSGTRRVIECRH